ncbi:hypothetical protein HY469_02930 [Candidatus Roizmanbacteria bacterium]|nr:hypothetical protein [Candidatus Roizmanbacteria bacterium]
MNAFLMRHGLSLLLISIFSVFGTQKLFTPQFNTSHDGEGHVIRMEEFHESLTDGQFPVRIAKRINYGLGYPFFTFNYPLVYYLAEGFHLSGLSVVDSFKALMILSIVVSGIGMYAFALLFFNKTASVFSSLLYIIAPYRFLNMYVRGNVAEQWGLALIPIALYTTEYSIRNKKSSVVPLGIILSLVILSHNITALISMTLIIFYMIARKGLSKRLALSVLFAILLTSFFWIPVAVEAPLTKLSELSFDYRDFFPTIREVLYSPWGFGPWKSGSFPGKMSPQIGMVHLLTGLIAVVLLLAKTARGNTMKLPDSVTAIFFAFVLLSLFLALPVSKFLWENAPFLSSVQIPWRFVGYITLGLSISGGYVMHTINRKWMKYGSFAALTVLLIYANRNHIRVNQYITYQSPFENQEVIAMSTTSKDEHMPKNAPRIFEKPNLEGDIIPSEAGTAQRTVWRSNYHQFQLDLETSAEFRDNTSYYPGWKALVDGTSTTIRPDEDEFYRLRITVPEGNHTVEFFLTEPWYRKLANAISIGSLLSIGGRALWKKRSLYSS